MQGVVTLTIQRTLNRSLRSTMIPFPTRTPPLWSLYLSLSSSSLSYLYLLNGRRQRKRLHVYNTIIIGVITKKKYLIVITKPNLNSWKGGI
ncbi:hypothetical protein LguiA_015458 [Lonicera macranthoides]